MAGGSGVIILKSPTTAKATTGSPTVDSATVSGFTIYTFNGDGTITF